MRKNKVAQRNCILSVWLSHLVCVCYSSILSKRSRKIEIRWYEFSLALNPTGRVPLSTSKVRYFIDHEPLLCRPSMSHLMLWMFSMFQTDAQF